MTAATVTVVCDLFDGSGAAITHGTAWFAPSVTLTDAADGMYVPQAPVPAEFRSRVSPSVGLLPTDDPSVLPSGFAWGVSFAYVAGNPASFNFFLPAGPATFTAAAGTPCTLGWGTTAALTSLPNGSGVRLSGGSVPSAFSTAATYYVTGSSGTTVSLATSRGGSAITSASAGSGSLTVVQYNLSALSPVGTAVTMAPYAQLGGDLSGTPAQVVKIQGTAIAAPTGIATEYLNAQGGWTAPPGTDVISVFGRTGAVAAQSGDYTAAQVGADASGAAATAQANAEGYAATVAENLDPVNAGFTYLAYNGAAVNAIGDGNSHPLSGVFATQAAAQSFFSAAYTATGIAPALTDELNWWVIQTYLADGNRVYIPAGTYLLHRALILPNALVTGLALLGSPGLSMLKLRSHTVSGGLADCSVIIDKWLLSQATSIALGTGYNYNNPDPALGENLTIAGLVIDGNSANAGSGFYPGYNYGIGIDAYSDITVRDVRIQNVNGWGYHESGTTATYTERGSYVNLTALNNAFWGCYVGYRNRKKAMANCIAMGNGKWTGANGAVGVAGSVKGSVQNTACGGFFLDCSEMTTVNLQAHGNNGDGVFIRNVLACQYKGIRATYNGGAGIHSLGLVSSHGADWLAVCNGTNPGLGSLNVATPAPDAGGTGGGGTGTYTGAPDVWFDDSANTYGITNFSQVTNIECGTNTSVSTIWGDAGAEVYGLWVDDGLGATDLVIRSLHNTSSLRVPSSWSSESLVIGDPQPYYATVTSNGSWTCPQTGYYRARSTSGAGGGGGGGGGSSTQAGGGGGAAGVPLEGTQFVQAGSAVTVTIGAGGTAGTGVSSGSGGNGGTGANTVIGSPFALTATGSSGGQGAPSGSTPGQGGVPGLGSFATGTQRFPGFGGAANNSSGAPFMNGSIGGGQGAAASGSNGGNGGTAGTLGGGVTPAASGTTATVGGGTGTSAAANSGCGGGGGGGGNTGGTGGNGGVGGSGLAEFWRIG